MGGTQISPKAALRTARDEKRTKPPLINIKHNTILMPGDTTEIPIALPDQQVIIEAFKATQWPPLQLATISNGICTLTNTTKQPVTLTAKKSTQLKITPTTLTEVSHHQPRLSALKPLEKLTHAETIGLIDTSRADSKIKPILDSLHTQYSNVFDKDLTGGYNGYYGKPLCKLNCPC